MSSTNGERSNNRAFVKVKRRPFSKVIVRRKITQNKKEYEGEVDGLIDTMTEHIVQKLAESLIKDPNVSFLLSGVEFG